MTAEHLEALEAETSTKRACELLGVSRATVLRPATELVPQSLGRRSNIDRVVVESVEDTIHSSEHHTEVVLDGCRVQLHAPMMSRVVMTTCSQGAQRLVPLRSK